MGELDWLGICSGFEGQNWKEQKSREFLLRLSENSETERKIVVIYKWNKDLCKKEWNKDLLIFFNSNI